MVMAKGSTLQLGVAAKADGISWSSADSGVASVDSSGLVTAHGPGQTHITAEYDDTALQAVVTVYSASIIGASSVARGSKTQLALNANPATGTWRWSSDNAGVSVGEWSGVVTGEIIGATANVTATLVSNPEITVTKTIQVEKPNLASAEVSLSQTSYTYDGSAKTPSVTVKMGGKTLVSNTNYTVAYSGNTNDGTATVKVAGKGDYTGEKSVTFKINAVSISIAAVTLSQANYAYDGNAKTPGVTVKLGSRTLSNGVDYAVTYKDNVKAGSNTASVLVSGKGNYAGSVTRAFSITKGAVSWNRLWGQTARRRPPYRGS